MNSEQKKNLLQIATEPSFFEDGGPFSSQIPRVSPPYSCEIFPSTKGARKKNTKKKEKVEKKGGRTTTKEKNNNDDKKKISGSKSSSSPSIPTRNLQASTCGGERIIIKKNKMMMSDNCHKYESLRHQFATLQHDFVHLRYRYYKALRSLSSAKAHSKEMGVTNDDDESKKNEVVMEEEEGEMEEEEEEEED